MQTNAASRFRWLKNNRQYRIFRYQIFQFIESAHPNGRSRSGVGSAEGECGSHRDISASAQEAPRPESPQALMLIFLCASGRSVLHRSRAFQASPVSLSTVPTPTPISRAMRRMPVPFARARRPRIMWRSASRGTEWLRIPDGLHPVRDDRRPTCGRIGDRTPRADGWHDRR
jgi:hypothetical protein